MALAGLAAADAAVLLRGVTPRVAERLRAAAQGNPLAMLEAAERLDPAQRTRAASLPQPLPVGEVLERDYGRLLTGLTPAAWRAVLLLAASHDEAEAPVVDALRSGGFDGEAALDEAMERGVIVAEAGRLTFRHPLLRSAAWSIATAAQHREAHRALAAVLPAGGGPRALHAAAAAAGRDEELAAELASLAGAMRARRGLAAASAVLERAAALTGDSDRAAGWLRARRRRRVRPRRPRRSAPPAAATTPRAVAILEPLARTADPRMARRRAARRARTGRGLPGCRPRQPTRPTSPGATPRPTRRRCRPRRPPCVARTAALVEPDLAPGRSPVRPGVRAVRAGRLRRRPDQAGARRVAAPRGGAHRGQGAAADGAGDARKSDLASPAWTAGCSPRTGSDGAVRPSPSGAEIATPP